MIGMLIIAQELVSELVLFGKPEMEHDHNSRVQLEN